jgi:protoheme IX farnesyltransferase
VFLTPGCPFSGPEKSSMSTAVAVQSYPALRDLLALTKPAVTALNLLAMAGGYFIAPGPPQAAGFAAALLGTWMVVSAANTLNCFLERDADRQMARTRARPLPSGRVPPLLALALGLSLGAAGVPLLWLALNPLTGLVSAMALVGYVCVYTPLKSKSSHALWVGAIPGAAPSLIGWTAATESLQLPGLLLFLLLFLWQVPHFLAVTLFRKEDYARAGFRVLASEKGERAVRSRLVQFELGTVGASLALGLVGAFRSLYLLAAIALGLGIVFSACRSSRIEPAAHWARAFFKATNLYLALLLASLMLDRYL